jgi:hypothetical protein
MIMPTAAVAPQRKKKEAPVRSLRVAADRVIDMGANPGCAVFLTRGLRALTRLVEALPAEALTEAATADTDYAVLVAALETPAALEEFQRYDPLAEVRLRGLEARQQLLVAEGGPLSGEDAARLLGISRQAVDKRRRAGRLLGIRVGPHRYAYPSWQFAEEGVLSGLEDVLYDLRPHDPWMQLAFMVNGNLGLDGKVPLEELRRGHVAAVRRAARRYGEQGGV